MNKVIEMNADHNIDSVPANPSSRRNSLIADRRGATAIEYGLIAALIAVSAISAMAGLGNQLSKTFDNVSSNMRADPVTTVAP